MKWRYNTGGREKYYKARNVRDCVTRAIAIANNLDYKVVYKEINRRCGGASGSCNARSGVMPGVYIPYLESMGWTWNAVPGATYKESSVHMVEKELPDGIVICKLKNHLVTVIEGVINDTYDCSDRGARCVLGYFTRDDFSVDTKIYEKMYVSAFGQSPAGDSYHILREVKGKLVIYKAVIEYDDEIGEEILLGGWNVKVVTHIDIDLKGAHYGDKFRFRCREYGLCQGIILPYGRMRNGILVAVKN